MKKFLVVFSLLLFPMFLLTLLLPLHDVSAVYEGVIRLHVLADSDSEEEQALKLKVRDAILAGLGEDFSAQRSKESAEAFLIENLDRIATLARETIAIEGYDHDVRVTLCQEYYPTREYESMRLPAGEYLSLRVIIGSGEGPNWWCMVYPPLCTSAAEAEEELSEAGFTPNQVRLLTDEESPEYVVRFKVAETVSSAIKKIKGFFS